MNTFLVISQLCIDLAFIAIIVGYFIYRRSPKIKTWEDGCRKATVAGFEWIYENITGKVMPDKIIHTSFMLNNEEVILLKKRLRVKPYRDLSAAVSPQLINGAVWYDFNTLGLIKELADISLEELGRMCHFIIKDFFDETKGCSPDIYIFIASPARLQFAIPLSVEASKRLQEQQEQFVREENMQPPIPDVLEEEIDLWEDEKEQEDDNRL